MISSVSSVLFSRCNEGVAADSHRDITYCRPESCTVVPVRHVLWSLCVTYCYPMDRTCLFKVAHVAGSLLLLLERLVLVAVVRVDVDRHGRALDGDLGGEERRRVEERG